MAVALVQEVYAEVGFPGTATLPGAPVAGNLLVAWVTKRETDDAGAPNGFTGHPDGLASASFDSGYLSVRVAETGDSATIGGIAPGCMAYIAELSGVDSYEWGADSYDDTTNDPIVLSDVMAGEGWLLAGVVWRTGTDFATEAVAPTDVTVELNDAKTGLVPVYHPLSWVAYAPADAAGLWSVSGDPNGAIVHTWGGRTVLIYQGGDLPEPPPVDPGYDPPDPGHAILEIYVHDEDATVWDTATWGDNDGIVEGTEGVWSGAGWQDVTPQGVTAHVRWGSSRPERGILAPQEAQDWLVTTYDPDRKLDPGNADSPWAPQLVSGVPIRISSSAAGRVIRTGVIDRISYKYAAPHYRGQIRATSTIATLYRADVPEDATLGDTLRERLRDVVSESGIAIGGIPVLGDTGTTDWYPDLALSAKLSGRHNAWEHIAKAGEEVLWVVYENAAGTLEVRPWGGPLDRGSEITYESLEDLESTSSEDGVYSVVYVTDDTSVELERVASPLPRYGRRPYTRSETTIDADAWATAVLADRSWPGVVWTPGTVWCFTQADVDFMASLELMERVAIVVPGVIEVTGRLLGMELWVEARTNGRTRWLFLPRIATDGSVSLGGGAALVSHDGEYLLSDSGETLEAD